ncbi:MAG TPA: HTTM domain-containing protein, partial [Polyangiaceae bacterium]
MKDGVRSSGLGRRLGAFWTQPVDVRPLGLMRITFGLVLLTATLDIAPVLFDLLSDDGVLPRAALFSGVARLDRFSVMDLAGPRWVSALMLALAVLSAASFTIGFHTRAATIACFVLVTGIHERNLAVFDGADNVIRVVLFWLMFAPAGACYSVDALLKASRSESPQRTAEPFAIRLLQIQFSWIYFASVLAKLSGTAWPRGTALHYALSLEHLFTRPLGSMLSRVPHLSTVGTYFTLGVEGAFLFLMFSPVLQPLAKTVALALGAGLHLGIALTMNVGSFSYLMIACYPLLFEGVWAERAVDAVKRLLGRAPSSALPASPALPFWETPPRRRGIASRVLLGALLVSALWFSIPPSARRHVPAQPRWLF